MRGLPFLERLNQFGSVWVRFFGFGFGSGPLGICHPFCERQFTEVPSWLVNGLSRELDSTRMPKLPTPSTRFDLFKIPKP